MLVYKQFSFEAVKGRLGNFSKMVSSTISTLIKIHFKRINFHGWIQLSKHNICTVCQSVNDVRYLNYLQLLSSKRCTSQRNHDHFFLFCRRKNTYLTKFVLYSAVCGSRQLLCYHCKDIHSGGHRLFTLKAFDVKSGVLPWYLLSELKASSVCH